MDGNGNDDGGLYGANLTAGVHQSVAAVLASVPQAAEAVQRASADTPDPDEAAAAAVAELTRQYRAALEQVVAGLRTDATDGEIS